MAEFTIFALLLFILPHLIKVFFPYSAQVHEELQEGIQEELDPIKVQVVHQFFIFCLGKSLGIFQVS